MALPLRNCTSLKTRFLILSAVLLSATGCADTTERAETRLDGQQRAAVAALPLTADTLDCRGVEVLRAANNKYGTIVFHDGCRILFDQVAIQQATPNAPAVGLYADIWEFRAPRTGTFDIGYMPVNLNGVDGPPGDPGVSRNRNRRVARPSSGGHADDGRPGDAGRTLHRLSKVILWVGQELRDLEGPLSADDITRLRITVDASGLPGGNGGVGGRGGNGGNGESGRDGKVYINDCRGPECLQALSANVLCDEKPVSGAPGGNAGRGGRGGRGADGGDASDIQVVAPVGIGGGIRAWRMKMDGGQPGGAGSPGKPGQPGAGGFAGNDFGVCKRALPGRSGIVPTPSDLGTDGPGINAGRTGSLLTLREP
jgi:hypothetical protein